MKILFWTLHNSFLLKLYYMLCMGRLDAISASDISRPKKPTWAMYIDVIKTLLDWTFRSQI